MKSAVEDATPKTPNRKNKFGEAKPAAKRKGPAAAQPKLTPKQRSRKSQLPVSAIGLAFETSQPEAIAETAMEQACVKSNKEAPPPQAIEILREPEPQPEPAPEPLGQTGAPVIVGEIGADDEVIAYVEDVPDDRLQSELQSLEADESLAADESVVAANLFKSVHHVEAVAATTPQSFSCNELKSTPAPASAPRTPPRMERLAPAPRSLGYLDRARRAAQAQSEALRKLEDSRFLAGLGNFKGLLTSVCAFALVLVTTGLIAASTSRPSQSAEGSSDLATEANDATGDAAPSARASETYDQARRLIGEGRTVQGLGLLEQAAADGVVAAQYDLSKRYESGDGFPRNLTLALSWAERAARGGDVRAMHNVGVYYARGEGVQRDEAAAFGWFREAAMHGVADSQYNLGVLYERGRGVAGEPEEALFWYLVAARNEDQDAIDRAVTLASMLSPDAVARIQTRVRAFESHESSVRESAPGAQETSG